MIKINTRIKEVRKYLGLTMEQFGEKIGLSKSGISSIENGNRNVTPKHIKLVCSEFNVNEEWLRTGKGEMFNYSEDDSLIEKLSTEYKLNGFVKRILKKYLELTEQQRNAVDFFLNKIYEEEFANPKSSENTDNELSATEEIPVTKEKPEDIQIENEEIELDYKNIDSLELLKMTEKINKELEKRESIALQQQKSSKDTA